MNEMEYEGGFEEVSTCAITTRFNMDTRREVPPFWPTSHRTREPFISIFSTVSHKITSFSVLPVPFCRL